MSGLELNKIAGAFLVGLLVLTVSRLLGDMLIEPKELEEPIVRFAQEEAAPAETATAEAAPAEVQPIATLLASANADQGKSVAKKCASCHSFEKGGPNKVGPNLYGVVGGPKAHAEGFSYSQALSGMGGEWTYDDLNAFLANPKAFAPGTKMAFAGLKTPEERADLIVYMRTMSDNPPPLPAQ